MKTKIRFNANPAQSARLREVQDEYQKRFAPTKISLEALANLAIEHGIQNARIKLQLAK